MFYNQQCWFMFIYIYMYTSVLFIYRLYKYVGMTPSGTYNCSSVIIFYFPCISLFYSFVCSSHLCILSYMHVPYGALFINKEFEFVCKFWEASSRIIKNIWLCCLTPLSIKLYSIENIYDIIIVLRRKYFLHSQSSKWNLNLLVGIKFLNLFSYSFK
jgi:hypothetical protein